MVVFNPYAFDDETPEEFAKNEELLDPKNFCWPVRFFMGLCVLIYAFILFGFIGLVLWFSIKYLF